MSRLTEQSPWDCSRQYLRYTHSERQYIISSYKRGHTVESIAKRCKRGEWAITVEVARHFNHWKGVKPQQRYNDKSYTRSSRRRHHRSRSTAKALNALPLSEFKKFAKAQQMRNVSESNINSTTKCAVRNRKFRGREEVVSNSAKEVSDHLQELLRGSFQ